MRIAILRRTPNESFSMDVYADAIVNGLKTIRPDWDIVELAPRRVKGNTRLATGIQRYYERYWRYPRSLKQQDVDLFHVIDHSEGHLAYWLQNASQPAVVTCHDLINLTHPETFQGRAQVSWLSMRVWKYAIHGLKQADHVISVSSHTAKDLVQHLAIAPAQITVIPNAVDQKFCVLSSVENVSTRNVPVENVLAEDTAPENVSTKNISVKNLALRQQYGIAPDTFCILNVGSSHLRKNIERILQALVVLHDRGAKVHFLKAGSDFEADQKALIQTHQLEQHITYLGEPDDRRLVEIYNIADALVAPSLYEGFGLTVLEAMACGTPVITSTTTSLPEVAGDAAILVEPTDIEAIVAAIQRLQTDSSCYATLVAKGIERAKQFTWIKTAEKIAEIYEKLLSEKLLGEKLPNQNHPVKTANSAP